MAAFALSEYQFKGNTLLALYLSLGIMIPIRLGTVGILKLMVGFNLVNTLTGTDSGLYRTVPANDHFYSQFIHASGSEGTQGCCSH